MTKYLRFMRHGATELNVANCWQGHADSPLTELGRRQAAETGEHIRQAGIEFDAILCSPLGRVIQTLECALPERAAQGFETSDGLMEMYFGILDGKKHVEGHPSSPYHDQFLAYGGETEDEVERRVCAALDELMSRPGVHSALAVSHGTTGRIFRNHWAALARVEAPRHLANCSLYTYEFDEDAHTFSLVDIYEPASATNPEDFAR